MGQKEGFGDVALDLVVRRRIVEIIVLRGAGGWGGRQGGSS